MKALGCGKKKLSVYKKRPPKKLLESPKSVWSGRGPRPEKGGRGGPEGVGGIPAELYQWIEDRQTDLQEALDDGNSARVFVYQCGCWVALWVRLQKLAQ